jgi:hypothetical protein
MSLYATKGPAIQPASELLAWFEGPGKGRLVQVPVVVVPSPLGLASGRVAGSTADDASAALSLKLDDTGMSVSLADKIRPDCAYDEPCAIWVEGYWGATVSLPGLDFGGPAMDTPKRHPFSVRRYVGRVTAPAQHIRLAETP